jgi:A/G-specific adenine glycosylase
MKTFASALLRWARDHGRTDLPWQPQPGVPADPYRVWVSEIMLQQTQVQSVRGYFSRFIERFPTVEALATASLDEVLALWSGLGYYARARNLHRAAQQMCAAFPGAMPQQVEDWEALPGVGRSTAAAVVSICFGHRAAILDANVRRVLARQIAAPEPWGSAALDRRLWQEAQARLPDSGQSMPRYTQALMDLGATVCTARRPRCGDCPVSFSCKAFATGRVEAFPVPRPRAPRPVRQERWLLVTYEGSIGLWQRPPQGLWGGLWTPWVLPESVAWPDDSGVLTMVNHGFTHFTLEAEVRVVAPTRKRRLLALSAQAAALGQALAFQPREAFLHLGLPAPIRRLLVEAPLGEGPMAHQGRTGL